MGRKTMQHHHVAASAVLLTSTWSSFTSTWRPPGPTAVWSSSLPRRCDPLAIVNAPNETGQSPQANQAVHASSEPPIYRWLSWWGGVMHETELAKTRRQILRLWGKTGSPKRASSPPDQVVIQGSLMTIQKCLNIPIEGLLPWIPAFDYHRIRVWQYLL